ncbi:MAG: hypothetical protein LBH76_06135, partial [Propionibacteriaceae bacterium]|nr:hypothetical protein [Propionibacteriaceae bacterium]
MLQSGLPVVTSGPRGVGGEAPSPAEESVVRPRRAGRRGRYAGPVTAARDPRLVPDRVRPGSWFVRVDG